MRYMEPTFNILAAALSVSLLLFGQAMPLPATGHIQGTVKFYDSAPVYQAQLIFQGNATAQTAVTDLNGRYQVDLPAGTYTMVAKMMAGKNVAEEYDRPLFHVASGKSLNLDMEMDSIIIDCDPVLPASGEPVPPVSNDDNYICGGTQDAFPLAAGNVPFEMVIRYHFRRKTEQGFVYYVGKHALGSNPSVEVDYNLFTLYADSVAYNVGTHLIEASGSVTAEWADGPTKHADSMRIKVENGEAVVLQ